ncbi:hypothetical protein BJF78_26610 [Pseudonocardia sp. CNS-139]|nr:hypothetical protein BJF78_26610 [Pseudonocardia sp. CNS-139]
MARPQSIDAGIAHIRDEVMPALHDMDGCVGLSMLVDRESGRCIVTTAWRDEAAMRGSEQAVRSIRDRAADLLGGRPSVDQWEIAVLHRDHTSRPGACVRSTWVRMDPTQAERGVDAFRMGALPTMQEAEGFCSASLLVDRTNGRAVSSVTFDSRDAMDRSRMDAAELRERVTASAGIDVVEVAEFDLALAHLRVPEMA